MSDSKSKSKSMMSLKEALKILKLTKEAPIEQINETFTTRLAELQKKYGEKPDKLVMESDILYNAYRKAYLSKDGASEEEILPLTISGPDSILNIFDINVPHRSMNMKTQSQAEYRDGHLVKKESIVKESFINKDGKKEVREYENGKLIRHTIDGRNMLR